MRGREYELKFDLPPGAAERLQAHPLLRSSLPRRETRRLASTYFDTPDAALRDRSISLRVRRSGAGSVQTVKSAGVSRVDRAEWEHEGGGASPDVAWLRRTPLGPVFAGRLPAALAPRFTVDVTRTVLPLRFGGAEIEAALDSGDIRAGGASLRVSEFELELKRGGRGGVLDLARALARDLPLVLSLASKAERGYAVADGSWGRPAAGPSPGLGGAKTLAAAFAATVEACLHALGSNAALIVGPPGDGRAEAVHRTRIALRHLRAISALFRPALRRRRFAGVAADVKWMSDLLGRARDADVMAASHPPARPEVVAALADERRFAHDALDGALASPRWRLLLIELLALASHGVRRRRRDEPAAPFLRRRLGTTRKALAGRTRGWARHGAGHTHDIRKRAKMLRYDLDLLAGLPRLGVKRRTLAKLGRALQRMQQHLGEVQDRAVLRERTGEPPRADRDRHDLRAAHRAARRLRRLPFP